MEDWTAREQELLDKIQKLEINSAEKDAKIQKLESGAELSEPQSEQLNKMKELSAEMLAKAKRVIYDKTKMCKNQELQIEALNAQIVSLKDVLQITRDLLGIRNLEVTQMQEKLDCLEQKIGAEHNQRTLMDRKMEALVQLNQDLRDEYQIQSRICSALKQTRNGGQEPETQPE